MASRQEGAGPWLACALGALALVIVMVTFVALNGAAAVRRTHLALNLPSADSLHRLPAPPVPTPPRS
jgi:hypothetical protein